jgi:hypothetical protein
MDYSIKITDWEYEIGKNSETDDPLNESTDSTIP